MLLSIAVISMISALTLYSIGVWSEKIAGWLKPWHLAFFVLGLVFDTLGTTIMGEIAHGFQVNIHGFTGILAIVLMFAHAAWAAVVLKYNQSSLRANFHKFSLGVWAIWLIPFLSGTMMAMSK